MNKKSTNSSLEDIRFISCQDVLNETIRPILCTSTSQIKITKFLSKWRYHPFADLHSSYIQIPIAKQLWRYIGVNSPFRGIRLLTQAGQGLLDIDVHLDQLMSRVLGYEIACGTAEVSRDDIQMGVNTVDQLINSVANWVSFRRPRSP